MKKKENDSDLHRPLEALPYEQHRISLTVNGEPYQLEVEPSHTLAHTLRETLCLTGTKVGCNQGACGNCTVHIDGEAMRSCALPVSALNESNEIRTIEGLSADGTHPVQKAWAELDVPQCGFCQPGMIMAVSALLARNPNPTDDDIDNEITNICRCGTFVRIRKGIHLAAKFKS